MKQITIKVFSACDAVKFFSVANPFMFHGERFTDFYRKHPEFYFLDHETGKPREVPVEIPDQCALNIDYGDRYRLDPFHKSPLMRTDGIGLYLEFSNSVLSIDYAIVDGAKIESKDDCGCCRACCKKNA